jgi:hypothetical protein
VRVRYIAGYSLVPDPIIAATVSVASAISQSGGALSGQIKMLAAGNSTGLKTFITNFAGHIAAEAARDA